MFAMDKLNIGIAGFKGYLPQKTLDAWEATKDSGISREKFLRIGALRVHQAAPKEMPSDMAITAAKKALADAKLDPAQIDVVIYTGSVKDHSRWQASARVQTELGCKNSIAFDVYQGCNGQNISMNIARSMILANESIKNVLITSAERYDTTLERPILGHTYLFGDGASAGIVSQDCHQYQILSSVLKTWGDHHHTFCVPGIGAATKLTPKVIEQGDHLLQVYNPVCKTHQELEKFGDQIIEIAKNLWTKAARRAEVRINDVKYVVMVNGSKRHNQIFLKRMGLENIPSSTDYIEETAHMGSPDVFYNLDMARQDGQIKKNDLIAFYTGGGGYTWAITFVRV
jgi:3-oxoacyl-[acyl-carrier-protein] synthase-3